MYGYFGGEENAISCPSNFVFHNTCSRNIWNHYILLHLGRVKHLVGLSGGCAEQYKSQYAVYKMTFICKHYPGLESYCHIYAPTGHFKCCCDACCNDTKSCMRACEGHLIFKWVDTTMPQPKPDIEKKDTTKRFHITSRHQRYVCQSEQNTDEMKSNDKVISVLPTYGNKK